jgi:hypothetical protein
VKSIAFFRAAALGLLLSSVACSNNSNNPASPSTPNNPSTPNKGTITATIDGAAFSGIATAATNIGGVIALGGWNQQTAQASSISIGIGALASVGTTSVGPNSPTNGNLIAANQSWLAGPSGGSGTLTITTLTATGATGTFSFSMVPNTSSGASGTKVIANGAFNVTF